MQDFLQVLLYIVIGFWVLRLIFKWIFPHLLKYFMKYVTKKAEKRYKSHQQNPFGQQNTKTEKSSQNTNSKKEKVGEYIDFEEID